MNTDSRAKTPSQMHRDTDNLRAVFQKMSTGVCLFSSTGEVMMHNPQFRRILNVPARLLAEGMTLPRLFEYMARQKLIRPDDVLQSEAWRRELVSEGWLRRRILHGKDKIIDIQAHLLTDGGFFVEAADVTLEARTTETLENRVSARTAELTRAHAKLVEEYQEKARVEEELRVAKERAETAVSSKTRFLAAASHDLLQPINAAKLLISTLQDVEPGKDHDQIVERLAGAFSSAEQLLQSLLDISRLDSAEPDHIRPINVNLGKVMESVFADQALLAETNNVVFDLVPSSVVVRSDPLYLLRSIQNLVVNAIQYTPPGGRVLVGCRRSRGQIRLEVWDTGVGIALKDQVRIFDEFARAETSAPTTGMGLGLSVVDRACRLLGHSLALRSKPGRGSVFSIGLDVVDGTNAVREPAAFSGEEQPLDYIILVIENDLDVLYSTTKRLEQWGASVLPAQCTKEALRFVDELGMRPDIVLADYELDNGEKGLDAIGAVRGATASDVPAILITANRRDALRAEALERSVSILTKPVKLSRLRPLIRSKVCEEDYAIDRVGGRTAGSHQSQNDSAYKHRKRATSSGPIA